MAEERDLHKNYEKMFWNKNKKLKNYGKKCIEIEIKRTKIKKEESARISCLLLDLQDQSPQL